MLAAALILLLVDVVIVLLLAHSPEGDGQGVTARYEPVTRSRRRSA